MTVSEPAKWLIIAIMSATLISFVNNIIQVGVDLNEQSNLDVKAQETVESINRYSSFLDGKHDIEIKRNFRDVEKTLLEAGKVGDTVRIRNKSTGSVLYDTDGVNSITLSEALAILKTKDKIYLNVLLNSRNNSIIGVEVSYE